MAEGTGNKRRLLGYLISALAVVALAGLVEWDQLVAAFSTAHLSPLALALLLLLLCYLSFGYRWSVLLIDRPDLPLRPVFAILMVGYMANLLFPLRPGDFLRGLLVDRRFDYGVIRGLASVAFERFFDLATLGFYGLLVILALPTEIATSLNRILAVTFGLLACAGLVIALLILLGGRLTAVETPATSWAGQLLTTLRGAVSGLQRALKDFLVDTPGVVRRLIAVSVLSLLGWSLFVAAMMACIFALEADVSWLAAIALTVVTNLGTAIPSSPAGIGVYHGLAVMTLIGFGVDIPDALAIAILSHGLVVATQAGLGFAALALGVGTSEEEGWRLFRVARARQKRR